MIFLYSLQSEWQKTKGSAAAWLCIVGGFFIPAIHLLNFIRNKTTINAGAHNIWEPMFRRVWMDMSYLFLPAGVVLASSLIAQMEYRNNSWKQLHTTPQRFTTIYWAKFGAIILMTLKFFLFFNIGMLLLGVVPCLLFDHQLPREPVPVWFFLKGNANFFIALLPLIAIQYVLSIHLKNFLVPIGLGLAAVFGTMLVFQWKYIHFIPFSYSITYAATFVMTATHYWLAVSYFVVVMVLGFILYINKSIKG